MVPFPPLRQRHLPRDPPSQILHLARSTTRDRLRSTIRRQCLAGIDRRPTGPVCQLWTLYVCTTESPTTKSTAKCRPLDLDLIPRYKTDILDSCPGLDISRPSRRRTAVVLDSVRRQTQDLLNRSEKTRSGRFQPKGRSVIA